MSIVCAIAVSVRLINLSSAPPSLIADAQNRVAALYAAIGVDLTWSRAQDSILLLVRDDEPPDLRRAADPMLGAAIHAGSAGGAMYVFYRRAADQADRYAVPRRAVLACAMAHEIGHLLLPASGHSRSGLMRAVWSNEELRRAATGDLGFSADEAATIRGHRLR